jgi:hypothetical protein
MRRSILLAVLATGCTGTDVGNPIQLDLSFESYNPEVSAEVAVSAAWIVIERVRLRPAGGDCEGDDEIEVEGQLVLDLESGAPVPALSDLELAGGRYCRLEVKWQTLDGDVPAGAPDQLVDAAIVVTGDAGGVPFVIRSERQDELRIDAIDDEGFAIAEGTSGLFVGFDLVAWLGDIDFTGLEVDGGEILIDDDNNPEALEQFDDALVAATRLFDDDDDDGSLDDDERDDDDTLAAGSP